MVPQALLKCIGSSIKYNKNYLQVVSNSDLKSICIQIINMRFNKLYYQKLSLQALNVLAELA